MDTSEYAVGGKMKQLVENGKNDCLSLFENMFSC